MIQAAVLAAILGHALPDWPQKSAAQWVQGGPLTLAQLRGKVVLIRFFTDADCPYCRATAPALNELARDFAPEGLVVIGMYTPKPRPRPAALEDVRGLVTDYGFDFPVAIDADWGALRRLWLDRVPDARFTSASLLVDRKGILRHVHEGGTLAKTSTDPKAQRDYDEMRKAVVQLLAEAP